MAILGLFSTGKKKNGKKAKVMPRSLAKAKRAVKKKAKTCEFC